MKRLLSSGISFLPITLSQQCSLFDIPVKLYASITNLFLFMGKVQWYHNWCWRCGYEEVAGLEMEMPKGERKTYTILFGMIVRSY